jgi:hypothetical protein
MAINSVKLESFIAENKEYEHIIRDIVKCTQYYTKQQVIDYLVELIKTIEFKKEDLPLTVLLNRGKVGSQHWLYLAVRDILPDHVVYDYRGDVFNSTILIMDDFIGSGNFIFNTIDDLYYYHNCYNNKILICAPFVCTFNKISEFITKYTRISNYKIISKISIGMYQCKDVQFLKKFQTITESSAATIHFEHKVPNQFGSFESIYSAICDVPDKSFMEDVKKEWEEENYFKVI